MHRENKCLMKVIPLYYCSGKTNEERKECAYYRKQSYDTDCYYRVVVEFMDDECNWNGVLNDLKGE